MVIFIWINLVHGDPPLARHAQLCSSLMLSSTARRRLAHLCASATKANFLAMTSVVVASRWDAKLSLPWLPHVNHLRRALGTHGVDHPSLSRALRLHGVDHPSTGDPPRRRSPERGDAQRRSLVAAESMHALARGFKSRTSWLPFASRTTDQYGYRAHEGGWRNIKQLCFK